MNQRRQVLLVFVLVLVTAAALLGVWRYRDASQAVPGDALTLTVPADCDSVHAACIARHEAFAVELSLGPAIHPMQPFSIQLRTVQGSLSDGARVELQFQMQGMDMGQNRYRLVAGGKGVWHGQAILPVCSQGRSDWIAQLDIRDGGRHWIAELPFTTD